MGRPKGVPTIAEMALKLLHAKVPVTENGVRRNLRSQEVMLMAARAKAMKGDLRAMEVLLRYAEMFADPTPELVDETMIAAEDEALFRAFQRDVSLGAPAEFTNPEKSGAANATDPTTRRIGDDDENEDEDEGEDAAPAADTLPGQRGDAK